MSPLPGTGKRILIVEDEWGLRAALEMLFIDEGFEVRTAEHGAAALEIVQRWPPDAIVLDIQMRVMDGLSFLRAYQRLPGPHASVVVCSTRPRSVVEAIPGVTAYVEKPFAIDDLVTAVTAGTDPIGLGA
jgi:CheY-like chemotaxis protein